MFLSHIPWNSWMNDERRVAIMNEGDFISNAKIEMLIQDPQKIIYVVLSLSAHPLDDKASLP